MYPNNCSDYFVDVSSEKSTLSLFNFLFLTEYTSAAFQHRTHLQTFLYRPLQNVLSASPFIGTVHIKKIKKRQPTTAIFQYYYLLGISWFMYSFVFILFFNFLAKVKAFLLEAQWMSVWLLVLLVSWSSGVCRGSPGCSVPIQCALLARQHDTAVGIKGCY